MNILIVSQYYDPEPVYLPATVARGLADRRHQVTVITGFPNYPSGRLYAGYRQVPWRKEKDGAVNVIRTALWVSHSDNPLGRFTNYLSFALSSLVACLSVRDPDVVYVYGAQMTASLGPSMRRFIRRTPYVLHIQDLWPESVTGSSMIRGGRSAQIITRVLNPILKFLYCQATATVAIAPTMARMLVSRGVPSSRINMVYNWANENATGLSSKASLRQEDQSSESDDGVLIAYAGNLGDHQDLERVIRAAKAVEAEKNLRFEFYGAGMAKDRLQALANELGVKNLTFCGPVPAADMASVYERADFQLVTLKDRDIFRGTIPSKLQAALFNGSAVMSNVAGDVAEICSNEQVGLTCEPGSVDSMADMFRRGARTPIETRRQMAANGRDFYLNTMSMDQGMDALEKILVEAAVAGTKK
jgi:colanic acid biosynthesis glycosyl transferase WcaI